MEWERIEGEREARGLDAFYRLGREYITMQGLLIETRNDLPATFHSTFIPRHFSLSAELTLYEISRFSPTLFASDIYFSFPPPPLPFSNYFVSIMVTDGHCPIPLAATSLPYFIPKGVHK